ncbi:GAF and ANTAR domain-containing protein [Agromyces agglutinans]|uniref:GAF and ANTAR domain-containing protein n=1 Tax=Agromyces agglutinans TaxID=2662258 RepID=UPI001FE8B7E9|nr:GAF and ANTAR domain-containing protein [Agromyces agglutinans]
MSGPFLEILPVSGAAVSTLGDLLGSETLSATNPEAAKLDEVQFDLGEGPCWEALATARPVEEPDVLRSVRWPAFTEAIRELPVRSLFAFPLVVGSLRIGAIDLYSATPMTLEEIDARRAVEMAKIVSRRVLQRALAEVGGEYAEDAGNIHSRRVVHQATGIVVAQLRVPPEDARLVIHGHAFATSRSVKEVATDLVEGRLDFSVQEAGDA